MPRKGEKAPWLKKVTAHTSPATGIPAGGAGLHGDATGVSPQAFSAQHQPAPEAKSAGRMTRAEYRAALAEKLDKVVQVYATALVDPDPRVQLVAAKQISVEMWGQPTATVEHAGPDGAQPITEIRYRWGAPKAADDS